MGSRLRMAAHQRLLDLRQTLTPADHQTHRHIRFTVPPAAERLRIEVRYAPKHVATADAHALAEAAFRAQAERLAQRVGAPLAEQWTAQHGPGTWPVSVNNLVTIALDDASGAYRGAGHRQAADQQFELAVDRATAGLVRGPLPAGAWRLTMSAHTLVSPQVDVSIQIGAEIAVRSPRAS